MSTGAIRAGRAYVEIGAKDKLTNFLKTSEKRLKSFGKSVSMMGAGMAAVGGAGVAALGGIVSTYAEFDDGMAAVRANTGASGEDLAKLRDMAKDLGATTKFSATEAAEGMNLLAKAGLNTKEIMAGLPGVLSLAAAGGVELGEASDIAANTASSFGLAADDIGRVSDVLATVANVSTTGVSEMGETFKYSAGMARLAGQSIEEMAAASAILASNGTKGSMAGTGLAGVLSKLSTSDVQSELQSLGVSVVDAAGNMRPMMDVMRDYGDATSNMSSSERISHAVKMFGEISAKSAISLATAGDSIDEMRDKMNGSAGAADKMAATMQDSVGGALTTLKSAIESVVIELGEALEPQIRAIAQTASDWARGIGQIIKQNAGMVATVAGVVLAIGAIGTALVGTGAVIAAFGAILGAISTAFSLFFGVIAAVLSPIGLLVAAVAALGGYLIYASGAGGKALKWLGSVFGRLKDDAVAAFGAIGAAIKAGDMAKAWQLVTGLMEIAWLELTDGIRSAWAETTGYLFDAGSAIAAAIGRLFQKLGDALKSMIEGYKALYDSIYNYTADKLNAGVNYVAGIETIGAPAPRQSAFDQTYGGPGSSLNGFVDGVSEFGKIMEDNANASIGDREKARRDAELQRKQRIAELRASLRAPIEVAPTEGENPDAPKDDPAAPEKPEIPEGFDPNKPIIDPKEFEKWMSEKAGKPEIPDIKPPEIPDIKPPEIPDIEIPEIGDIEDSLGPLAEIPSGEELQNASGQSNAGTFSSAAAALMGAGAGGGSMDRVARATEKSEERLQNIDKNIAIVAQLDFGATVA